MADGGALRVLFAELGFDVDEAALRAANARVNEVAQALKDVVPASERAESAVVAAAKAADAALRPFGRTAAAVVEAVTELGETWGAFQTQRLAQTEVLANATAASMGVSAEVQRDIDAAARDVEQAEKRKQDAVKKTEEEARKAREELAKRANAPAERARRQREDYEFQKLFDDSAEGKVHAAWQRELAEAEEAKRPINSLSDAITRMQAKATVSIGERLPAAFLRWAGSARAAGGVVLGTLLAVVTAAAGVVASTHAFAQQAEALRDTAREARTTSQGLQAFQFAGDAAGVGADRMTQGLTHLAQSLRAAEMHLGGNGIGWRVRRLGVDLRDSAGKLRDPVDVSVDLAVALDRVTSPARRAREAIRIYGDAGRRMLDIMHPGPGGLAALVRRFRELGGGVTPAATAAARDYARAQAELRVATDSLRSVLAVGLLPAMGWFVNKATDLAAYLSRITRNSRIVQASFTALGVTVAAVALATVGAWGPVVAPILAVAAAVAGLALVFDDLWVFIQGGDSALGRFLDKSQGRGYSVQFAHELRELWKNIAEYAERADNSIERIARAIIDSRVVRFIRATQARAQVYADAADAEDSGSRERPEAVDARAQQAYDAAMAGHDVPSPPPDGSEAPLPAVPTVQHDRRGQAFTRVGTGPRENLYTSGQGQAPWRTAAPMPVVPTVTMVPWRGVPWRAPAAPGGEKTVTHRDNRLAVNLYGVTMPEVAQQVATLVQRQQQQERDGDHPAAEGEFYSPLGTAGANDL